MTDLEKHMAGQGWITIRAAAKIAHVDETTMRRWARGDGMLVARRVGMRWFVEAAEVERLVEAPKAAAQP